MQSPITLVFVFGIVEVYGSPSYCVVVCDVIVSVWISVGSEVVVIGVEVGDMEMVSLDVDGAVIPSRMVHETPESRADVRTSVSEVRFISEERFRCYLICTDGLNGDENEVIQ
jgi:hypothetical protein